MAASFLTAAQRDRYGRYPDVVTQTICLAVFISATTTAPFEVAVNRRKPLARAGGKCYKCVHNGTHGDRRWKPLRLAFESFGRNLPATC